MNTYIFKSTKNKEQFMLEVPDDYQKISLPYFNEWVTALESGKYRQATGRLCKPLKNKKLGYCCLGVLSKIQGTLLKIKNGYGDHSINDCGLSRKNDCFKVLFFEGLLPASVSVYKNSVCYTNTIEPIRYKQLSNCNDNLKLSFKDIAKIIKILYKA